MNFWETITGSDLTRDWKAFEARAGALPPEYRAAWSEITTQLFAYGDFTGRNLTPIADSALGLLEETAGDGLSIEEVFGHDIPGFCEALAGGANRRTYRDRWRAQLNRNVARRLSQLGG
ncbi:DUF1048 domain-containing protein [Microbacterium sp. NPDC019599]|uniref:DUF1048 domain-containing protein n=1 Tax=Microbacterium sp. NPDC019599 TaxID=3154690 RepID=UPI0033C31297